MLLCHWHQKFLDILLPKSSFICQCSLAEIRSYLMPPEFDIARQTCFCSQWSVGEHGCTVPCTHHGMPCHTVLLVAVENGLETRRFQLCPEKVNSGQRKAKIFFAIHKKGRAVLKPLRCRVRRSRIKKLTPEQKEDKEKKKKFKTEHSINKIFTNKAVPEVPHLLGMGWRRKIKEYPLQ